MFCVRAKRWSSTRTWHKRMEERGSDILPGTQMEKSAVYVPLVAGDQARGVIDVDGL